MRNSEFLEMLKEIKASAKTVAVRDSGKTRVVFDDFRTFDLFGGEDKVLDPWNDYAYKWFDCLLQEVIDQIEDISTDKEILDATPIDIGQLVDVDDFVSGLVDVYTSELTTWLGDRNTNVFYIDEVLEEIGQVDSGFSLLQMAQHKAIEELVFKTLSIMQEILEGEA